MPTVGELSDPYANFMLGPRQGPNVCRTCFNLTDGYGRCYACAHGGRWLDAVAPVSYSVDGGQLHHALVSYKRRPDSVGRRFSVELAAVLWRHLAEHEACVARKAGVPTFTLVTTVPSSDQGRAGAHPLHSVVSTLVGPVRGRHQGLLSRSPAPVAAHRFSVEKFECHTDLTGHSVLVIDDMWTSGANAQAAAAALKAAGAETVAAVVIGRHLNRGWRNNDDRIRNLPRPFDWSCCALCQADPHPRAKPAMSAQVIPIPATAGSGAGAARSPPPGGEDAAPVAPGDRFDLGRAEAGRGK